jgi:RNA-binding protein NOB1
MVKTDGPIEDVALPAEESIDNDAAINAVADQLSSVTIDKESDPKIDDDDDGWITPQNYRRKRQTAMEQHASEAGKVPAVACVTTDYAMQNVLLHIGIHLWSLSGQRIQSVKTFVLRCHACYQ